MQISFNGLKENIHNGWQAIGKLKSQYPYGFVSNSKYSTFSSDGNPKIEKKLSKRIEIMRDIVDLNERKGYTTYEAVENAVKKTNAANCSEQSTLLSKCLSEEGIKNKIVTMNIFSNKSLVPVDGHCFCVIGLNDGAVIDNIDTWGKDAVIVDMWANMVGPAKKVIKKYVDIFQQSKFPLKFYNNFID